MWTDMMAEKLVSKATEIFSEKGSQLRVGGPSIGRSWSFPDLEAPGEEFEISISVRRVDRERPMSEVEARAELSELGDLSAE